MLSATQISSLMISGFAIAGMFGSLLFAWARKRWRTMSLFACTSLALAIYQLAMYVIQASPTVGPAMLATRLNELGVCMFFATLPFLYRSLCGKPYRWQEYTFLTIYIAASIVALASPTGYAWDSVVRMEYVQSGGLYSVIGTHSKGLVYFRMLHLVVLSYCIALAWQGWRNQKTGLWPVLILPVCLLIVVSFLLGEAIGLWRSTFDLGGWSAIAMYIGLATVIFNEERNILHERDSLFALTAEREQLLTAFSTAGMGFFGLLDPQGRLLFGNRAALELVNVTPSALKGKHFADTPWWSHSIELQNQLRAGIEQAAAGNKVRFAATHPTLQGGLIEVDFSLSPYIGPNGTVDYLVAEGRDVTAQREAEEAIRKSEFRYRNLFENMTSGFALCEVVCDLEGKPIDCRFLEINPEFEKQIGLPVANLIGKTALEVFPGTESYWIQTVGEVALTREPISYENYSSELQKYYNLWAFSPEPGQCAVILTDVTDRHNALEALRRSERRLSLAISATADAVWEWDPKSNDGSFSPRWYEMLGYADQEIPMNLDTFKSICHPDDLENALQKIEHTLAAGSDIGYEVEFRVQSKQGKWLWILSRGNVVERDEYGKPILLSGTNSDISERRQTESKWRRLMDSNMVAVIHWRDDGAILDANDSFLNLLGYTRAELLAGALDWQTLTPEAHRDADSAAVIELMTKDICSPFEKAYLHKDGSEIPVLITAATLEGDKTQGVAFILDISERNAARQKLVESEERNRELIQNAPDAIVVLDMETGKYVEHNVAAEELYGLSAEEMRVVGPLDVSPPIQPDGTLSEQLARIYLGETLEGRSPRFEWTHLHKSGREIPCEIWLTRIPNPGRVLVRGSMTDISARKSLEAQLLQSQKMEAVGQLAGGVAHDFNNLLTVIMGYSEQMTMDLDATSDHWLCATRIHGAAERAAGLTRQLLTFSRKQVQQPRVISPQEMLLSLEPLLRRLIGEDIELTIKTAKGLGLVRVDPTQIEQVLLNLIINARDAIPTVGSITLDVNNRELDEHYTRNHVGVTPGQYVEFSVCDTGSGMSPEMKSHIFEPFFSTKGPEKGTGLGLATVYGIVTQSQGHISVYSELGHGSTFKVYLPRIDAVAEKAKQPEKPGHMDGGSETILLTEDDRSIREFAYNFLASMGYTVIAASDGQEALDLAENYDGSIDLLVTDVVMPKMNGRELSERLTQLRPNMKTLYMSGYTDDAVVRQGILMELTHFLDKPFTMRGLLAKVRQVLDTDVILTQKE